MRKLILIAAMVLVSASAQAGPSRNLTTVASNDAPAAAEQPKAIQDKAVQDKAVPETAVQDKAVDNKAGETPKFVERPAAVETTAEPAKADPVKPVADVAAPKVEKKHRHESTEARVIYELHRHGIYW
jgi:hypothetical protein